MTTSAVGTRTRVPVEVTGMDPTATDPDGHPLNRSAHLSRTSSAVSWPFLIAGAIWRTRPKNWTPRQVCAGVERPLCPPWHRSRRGRRRRKRPLERPLAMVVPRRRRRRGGRTLSCVAVRRHNAHGESSTCLSRANRAYNTTPLRRRPAENVPCLERTCADTIGTVLVPWAGHFQR